MIIRNKHSEARFQMKLNQIQSLTHTAQVVRPFDASTLPPTKETAQNNYLIPGLVGVALLLLVVMFILIKRHRRHHRR